VHAGSRGTNVVVRRDGGAFHVLGGGAGNETARYEFEKGVALEPGYHVFQVQTPSFRHLASLASTAMTQLADMAGRLAVARAIL
jgi:hypothetical protein